jgi:RNA polymerase sigma-70 factor (ECF subfamily)
VSPQEITEIAKKVGKGDAESFAPVVEEYKGFVFNFASQMSGSHDLAQDMTQEVFLRAFSQLSKYRPDFPFKSWLGRVAYTTILNCLRKKRESIHIESLSPEVPFEVRDESATPDEAVIEKVTRETVRNAIVQLRDDLRAVIVLCEIEGVDITEASKILQIPEGTVKSRLFRAKGELKNIILRTISGKSV